MPLIVSLVFSIWKSLCLLLNYNLKLVYKQNISPFYLIIVFVYKFILLLELIFFI